MMELKQNSDAVDQFAGPGPGLLRFLSEPASDDEASMIEISGGLAARSPLLRPGLVAGIGLRAVTSEVDLITLLDTTLSAAQADRSDLVALVTVDKRADHPALVAAAAMLGLPVLALAANSLDQAVPNPSEKVADLASVNSVAEAAALAFGPLLVEKQRSANVTCALSRYLPVEGSRPRAWIAASTVPTSSAGP